MKKFVIYTDPHFCQYSSIIRKRGEKYSARLHNLIDSISWAEGLAESEKCDGVLMAGDFFDRPEISAEEITALQDIKFAKVPHTFITGNHDSNVSSLDFSSIQVFKSLKADIITRPEILEVNDKVDIYFIPYISNTTHPSIKSYLKEDNKKKIVITHNDIAGIRYGRFVSESGFEVNEILENCTLFLNGHLHNGCVIDDRIVLIGNLTGLNFNENAQNYEHYAYILTINDDGTIDLEPRVNPYAFNFYKLFINTERDIKKLDLLKDNSVLSVSCNSSLLSQVDDIISKKKNVVEYKIICDYNNTFEGEEVDFKVEDHLKQFVEYVQTQLPPSKILTEELILLGGN